MTSRGSDIKSVRLSPRERRLQHLVVEPARRLAADRVLVDRDAEDLTQRARDERDGDDGHDRDGQDGDADRQQADRDQRGAAEAAYERDREGDQKGRQAYGGRSGRALAPP